MKKFFTIGLVLLITLNSLAQDVYKFAIHFTDKNNSEFSLSNPSGFLSTRSIERREKFNISLDSTDLPVNDSYIQSVLNTSTDAQFLIEVKWLNAIVISLTDSSNIEAIAALPHVKNVVKVFRPNPNGVPSKKMDYELSDENFSGEFKLALAYDSSFYGGGWVQISQLNGQKLHELGYKGAGIQVAVLDAGFIGVDQRTIFQRLWDNGQILGTANMVTPGLSVFADHSHGTAVLSTMGGYWEGKLVGTAPDADYWLIRTEDGATEFLIEEYNWVAGAAFADSVGADVLNTSLGYTTFDDITMDHTWDDLDGHSTIITQGANLAYAKGMIAVNSAGNSGTSSWRYVGAPADGVNVFSIGAIDDEGIIAPFSSHGFPWSDIVKPNVVARGASAYVASSTVDAVSQSSGTSFSSPILAGITAALWSADPTQSPKMIKQAIQYSSDKFIQPDTLYGYGLPDFEEALNILGIQNPGVSSGNLTLSPNPTRDFITVDGDYFDESEKFYRIMDIKGQVLMQNQISSDQQTLTLDVSQLSTGIYILEIIAGKKSDKVKFSRI